MPVEVTGLFGLVNGFARDTGWLNEPVLLFATYGVVLFAALLVVGFSFARTMGSQSMAAALWAGVATLLAVWVNQPIVHAVNEARPYTTHHDILVLAHRSADGSFPSDHAVMAGAVTTGLFLVSRRLGAISAVVAALMAFSRVYIAAHYPHDVLAGLGVGAAVVLIGWLLLARPLTWLVRRLRGTRLRPLLRADSSLDNAQPLSRVTAGRGAGPDHRRSARRRRSRATP